MEGLGDVEFETFMSGELRSDVGNSTHREEFTELAARVGDVGNTLGGVESSDLEGMSAAGPPELVHLLLDAYALDLTHVEL